MEAREKMSRGTVHFRLDIRYIPESPNSVQLSLLGVAGTQKEEEKNNPYLGAFAAFGPLM